MGSIPRTPARKEWTCVEGEPPPCWRGYLLLPCWFCQPVEPGSKVMTCVSPREDWLEAYKVATGEHGA
jgi:hypothetical protein